MGHAAAYADVVDEKTVRKFCPLQFQQFLAALETANIKFEDFAQTCERQEEITDADVDQTFGALQEVFEKNTGLPLYLGYHNSEDNGDRYDEVDGAYWYVEGMYELTPAGKKMSKYVERKTFVTFG